MTKRVTSREMKVKKSHALSVWERMMYKLGIRARLCWYLELEKDK